MSYRLIKPIIDCSVRDLCYRPYPGHKKGCPNYAKKQGCPPQAKRFIDFINLDYPVFAIWNVFDLVSHIDRMRKNHANWSDRQLVCCLYWQPKARIELENKILSFLLDNPECGSSRYVILRCPEATGINITATMALIGEELEWPPRTKTYQIAIAGRLLDGREWREIPDAR